DTPALPPLSLHDALPICPVDGLAGDRIDDVHRLGLRRIASRPASRLHADNIASDDDRGDFTRTECRLVATAMPAPIRGEPCRRRSEEHTSELQSRENLVC